MSMSVTTRPLRSTADPRQLELFDSPRTTASDGEASPPTPRAPPPKPTAEPPACNAQRYIDREGEQADRPASAIAIVRPETMAAVLEHFLALKDPGPRPGEVASAVRQLASVLGRELSEIPSEPSLLSKLLASANPAMAGMRPQRWSRVVGLAGTALGAAGFEIMPGRDVLGPSPAWQAALKGRGARYRNGLSRFASFCSRRAISPAQVDERTFALFLAALTTASLQPHPIPRYKAILKIWNEAARKPGWPAGPVAALPDARQSTIPPEAFPAQFRADLEAYLNHAYKPHPFRDGFKPLSAETIRMRRKVLYRAARVLVATGFPVEQIVGLSVLVDVGNARKVLDHIYDRSERLTPSLGVLASTLCSVAARWVKPPETELKELAELAKVATPSRHGMTEKNRERLRPFQLQKNLDAILRLPARVVRRVEAKDRGDNSQAVQMMLALAIEILTVAPMRLRNLNGLRLDQHIKYIRRGKRQIVVISIPPHETKTNTVFEVELPPETVRLLDIYLKKYRSRLAEGAGPYLFPGRGGAIRAKDRFSASISSFIKRETGLEMHTHLFRHFAAWLYLRKHPEGIETVRCFLGHGSTRTTLKAYADPANDHAFRRLDTLISDHREGLYPEKPARSGRASQGRSKK